MVLLAPCNGYQWYVNHGSYLTPISWMHQAGGKNEAREVKMPAGLPRLFKSALDWNLYSTQQHGAADRQARGASGMRACCRHALLSQCPVACCRRIQGCIA